jgi:hypothetical protein
MPKRKAKGIDAWDPTELKALPWAAIRDLTRVLRMVEAEGRWPDGLRGAIVSLLPKKARRLAHGPKAHCAAPPVYRVWASVRARVLKDWLREHGHSSAWGQGSGRGADTAAWIGAAEAEAANARGEDAFGAMIDADKCYDRVPLEDLAEAGAEEARLTRSEGLKALVGLAVEQYGGGARCSGGALSPNRGIPPGV